MLEEAAAALCAGGVVVHATEGVWGLACDPGRAEAVEKILALKGRGADKGLLLIAHDAQVFARHWTGLGHAGDILKSWPGHHTWVLPNHGVYADYVTGGRTTVACRVPGHVQARQLCKEVGHALVSTSANLSGQPPVVDEAAARALFADHVDVVLPGRVGDADGPSTIHDLDGRILR